MVISACPIASALGLRVLKEGGNAADAAATVGFALAATYPQAGNLGGGGFALVVPRGQPGHVLDYREVAPKAVDPDGYVDANGRVTERCRVGGAATAVPGTVAGMAELLGRYGRWKWDRVLAPVIDLAKRGHWLMNRQATYLRLYEQELSRFEETKRCFLIDGASPLPGTHLTQPDLARALQTLADAGPQDFYEGTIAEAIVRNIQSHGGVLDEQDLRDYSCRWREPQSGSYLGWELLTTPPPSGGGFVVSTALKLLEAMGAHHHPPGSAERLRLVARVLRVAFFHRRALVGDPDWMDDAALQALEEFGRGELGAGTLEQLEREAGAIPSTLPPPGGDHTTHYCVIDGDGLAVSNTYSLNTLFGNKLCVDGYGFLLNNTIDDFQILEGTANWYGIVEGDSNRLAPGRRPVGSMCPTLLRKEGTAELVIGAAGGPRIPSLITQVTMGVVADGLAIHDAMRQPRVHHQRWPDVLQAEDSLPPDVRAALAAGGFEVSDAAALGIGTAILALLDGGRNTGALDHRSSAAWGGIGA
jgi:gamma-glutamyltranspeptidase/glutathione hydrolase